jgi:hypothetical protein
MTSVAGTGTVLTPWAFAAENRATQLTLRPGRQ